MATNKPKDACRKWGCREKAVLGGFCGTHAAQKNEEKREKTDQKKVRKPRKTKAQLTPKIVDPTPAAPAGEGALMDLILQNYGVLSQAGKDYVKMRIL